MSLDGSTASESKAMLWTGRVMSALPALMLLMSAVMNLVKPAQIVKQTTEMGYPEAAMTPLGLVTLASVILYLVPRTAVLGAILLTGYLGGAVDVHVSRSEGWFEILFPVLVGVFLWGGLFLRDARLRAIFPWRS